MGLFPKNEDFFKYFRESAANALEAAKFLESVLQNDGLDEASLKKLEEFEHRGDRITHDTIERLNRTFITPFDREDIHQLASSLDDIVDFIFAASEAMVLYKINPIPEPIKDFAKLLAVIIAEVLRAIERLSNLKHPQMILAICIEINRLENEADNIHRRALANLFEKEKDPISIIKIKDILEDLETATDKCEDVANVIEGIVLKNA
jgi:Phosphate transport regulator (distant homolog of PhoU)